MVAEQLHALACPDDLLTLFAELGALLEPGSGGAGASQAAEPSSALGLFLRRRVLAFGLLQYEARAPWACMHAHVHACAWLGAP